VDGKKCRPAFELLKEHLKKYTAEEIAKKSICMLTGDDKFDPETEAAQIVRRERTFVLRPEAGTEPRVRYIQNKNLDIVKIR